MKNQQLKFILIPAFFAFGAALLYGVEIPLESTTGGESFGFVDVSKLFEAYPKVKEAKQECEKMRSDNKEHANKMEKEIESLKSDISALEGKITILKNMLSAAANINVPSAASVSADTGSAVNVSVSTPAPVISAPAVPVPETSNAEVNVQISSFNAQIAEKKTLIETKTKEFEELKVKTEKEACELEDSKTQIIMADFYSVISEVAKEENISVVVDKSSILFGQPGIDLTDKVLDRLRGK